MNIPTSNKFEYGRDMSKVKVTITINRISHDKNNYTFGHRSSKGWRVRIVRFAHFLRLLIFYWKRSGVLSELNLMDNENS